jgi:hypothetical protein
MEQVKKTFHVDRWRYADKEANYVSPKWAKDTVAYVDGLEAELAEYKRLFGEKCANCNMWITRGECKCK